jgi:hypothetical protein
MLHIVFEKNVDVKGIPGFRFTTDPKMFQGPKNNPDNWCYCVEKDPKACDRDGLLMLTGCADGSPISMSQAHFYGAQESFIDAIGGISPNEEKHKTFMDIEPVIKAHYSHLMPFRHFAAMTTMIMNDSCHMSAFHHISNLRVHFCC